MVRKYYSKRAMKTNKKNNRLKNNKPRNRTKKDMKRKTNKKNNKPRNRTKKNMKRKTNNKHKYRSKIMIGGISASRERVEQFTLEYGFNSNGSEKEVVRVIERSSRGTCSYYI